MPGSSGSKDSGGGDAGDDLDAALKQVDELSGKLDQSEKMIFDMLSKAIPKVEIPMPKLSPSMFGASGGDGESEPLLGSEVSAQASDAPKPGAKMTKAKKKAEEVRKKTLEAKKQAEEARQQMAEEAKAAMANQMSAGKQVLAQSFAAATSVAVGVAISMAPVSALLGQIVAGVSATVINFLGLASSWKGRASGIFQTVSKIFDKIRDKVVKILDTVDDMIMGPLEKLENAIEDMEEEQKPNLDKMKQMESGMKMIDKNFDLPDPEDLKKPLAGCDSMIDEFVDKAKKEIPDKMTEIIQSTLAGRLATDESTFNLYMIVLPLSVVLIFNVLLALAQVWLMFTPEDSESDASGALTNATRSLRGTNMTSTMMNATTTVLTDATITMVSTTPLPMTNTTLLPGMNATMLPKLPQGMSLNSVMPYIQPALVQILLAALQLVAALILSSGGRICSFVNGSIADFGKNINDRINKRIEGTVKRVFGDAFKEVKEKADLFFPKFKDAIKTLKQALETAAKAGAMASAMGDAAKGIGKMF